MPPNSFKSDESFLEKLAVGAAGANATIKLLKEFGYQPIELERGSTGYKIWKKIKIQRVRVPDILCLKCGQRFESRGKTKLEISMSHSLKDPNRAWDAGMRPDDYVAFLSLGKIDNTPVNWIDSSPIHFVMVKDMQDAYRNGSVKITTPKGVKEGSEIRVIWPSTTAHEEATVIEVNEKLIKLSFLNQPGSQKCILARQNFSLIPQCKQGELVHRNQIIASTVPIQLNLLCNKTVAEKYFLERLKSAALSERYAAAKALRFRGYKLSGHELLDRMADPDEDIYVKLEAAAALASNNNSLGWDFLENSLNSSYLTIQLETVIVISEISASKSQELLIRVLLNSNYDNEVRAGAAWALGEFRTNESASSLINAFNSKSNDIKIEAARALLKIAPTQIFPIIDAFKNTDSMRRDGIAWTLARSGGFDINDLINPELTRDTRGWVSYIAGYGKGQFSEDQFAQLFKSDPEIYFAASVLWQLLSSWIYGLGEY